MDEAMQQAHPFDLDSFIPDTLMKALSEVLSHSPHELASRRAEAISTLLKRKIELKQAELEMKQNWDEGLRLVLGNKNLLLWAELLEETNIPDKSLVQEVREGLELTGQGPRSRAYPALAQPPATSMKELDKRATWRRKTVASLCRTCGDHNIDQELWNVTLQERDRGWLSGPFSADQLDVLFPSGWSPIKRFPVVQGNKVRPVDYGKEVSVNEAYGPSNKLTLMDIDCLGVLTGMAMDSLNTGTFSFLLSNGEKIDGVEDPIWMSDAVKSWVGRRLDLKSAYKQLAIRPSARSKAIVAVYQPGFSQPALFVPNALLFGTTASVFSFNRAALSIWHIAVTS